MQVSARDGSARLARVKHVIWMVWALLLPALAWAQDPPIITTLIGGSQPFVDGMPARDAYLPTMRGIAIDAQDNVYLTTATQLFKRDALGQLWLLAGNGQYPEIDGYFDGVPAKQAPLFFRAVAVDRQGQVFFSSTTGVGHIYRIDANGVLRIVAGRRYYQPFKENVPATSVALSSAANMVFGPDGRLYFSMDYSIYTIAADGIVRRFAGKADGSSTDGVQALDAYLGGTSGMSFGDGGALYLTAGVGMVKRIGSNGVLTTLTGVGGYFRDPDAMRTNISAYGIAADPDGNLYVSDDANVLRFITREGATQVIAGKSNDPDHAAAVGGFSGDGGPAAEALVNQPRDVVLDSQRRVIFLDWRNMRVRQITPVAKPYVPAGLRAFHPAVTRALGSAAFDLAVADMNADGRDDVVVTTGTRGTLEPSEVDHRVWVFLQRADGLLDTPRLTPKPQRTHDMMVTDLNHDGYPEVVLGTDTGLLVFRNSATGLQEGVAVAGGVPEAEQVTELLTADFNGDGQQDIAARVSGTYGIIWANPRAGLLFFYGNGQGALPGRHFLEGPAGGLGFYRRAVDFNRDGKSDIVAAWSDHTQQPQSGVELMLNGGAVGMLPALRLGINAPGRWGFGNASAGDFNGDGRTDLAVVSSFTGSSPAGYLVLRQDTNGMLIEQPPTTVFDGPDGALTADINGDGLDDLLLLHSSAATVSYIQQTARGMDTVLKYPFAKGNGAYVVKFAVGDVNGDHCKDVVVLEESKGLQVMYGRQCSRRAQSGQPLIPGATQAGMPPMGFYQATAHQDGSSPATIAVPPTGTPRTDTVSQRAPVAKRTVWSNLRRTAPYAVPALALMLLAGLGVARLRAR